IRPAASPTPEAKALQVATPAPTPIQRDAAVAGQPAEAASVPTAAKPGRDTLRLGLVGPAAWPSALEDVVGYALWPADYSERLRSHGIGDVLATAFTPGAALVAKARAGATKPEETKSTTGA